MSRNLARVVVVLLAIAPWSVPRAADEARAETIVLVRGTWYEARWVKFKPGKAGEALALARAHFRAADQDIGRRTVPFDIATGPWDHVLYTPIAFSANGYDTVPPRAAWWQALAAREGGMGQAKVVFQSFVDLIADSRTEIARLAD